MTQKPPTDPPDHSAVEEPQAPTRPLVDDLADVSPDEHIVRFVTWNAWQENPADGRSYLTAAFMRSGEFGPHPDSYGPSVWIESKLNLLGGVAALEATDPKLVHKGIVRVPVREVTSCNIKVKASPKDADPKYAAHASAHASFVGIDEDKRDQLLDRCQAYIFRPPPNGSKKPPP